MQKIKKIFDTRLKSIIAIVALLITVLASGFGVYALTSNKTYLKLKKENIIIEYGQQLPAAIEDYLDVKGFDKNELKKIKLTTDVKNENDKEFPAIGTYKVELTYKKEKVSVDVEVKDTTKPTFEVFNDIVKIEVNANDVNLESYYKTNDLSSVNITVDGSIDLGIVGTYEVKVVATDSSDNKETKNAKIEIVTLEQAYAGDVTATIDNIIPASDALVARRLADEEAKRLADEQERNKRENTNKNNTNTNTTGGGNGTGNTGNNTSGGSGNTGGETGTSSGNGNNNVVPCTHSYTDIGNSLLCYDTSAEAGTASNRYGGTYTSDGKFIKQVGIRSVRCNKCGHIGYTLDFIYR